MWSPIPRTPTSCARSTWSPPNIGRSDVPTAAGPLVRRLFCPRTRRHPAAYTADAAGFPRRHLYGGISHVLLSVSELLPPLLLRKWLHRRKRRDFHPALLPRAARLSRRRLRRQHPLAGVCLLPRLPVGYRRGRGWERLLRLLPELTAPAAPAGAATYDNTPTQQTCRPADRAARSVFTQAIGESTAGRQASPTGCPESPPAPPRWDTDAPPPPPGNRSRPAPQTTG